MLIEYFLTFLHPAISSIMLAASVRICPIIDKTWGHGQISLYAGQAMSDSVQYYSTCLDFALMCMG